MKALLRKVLPKIASPMVRALMRTTRIEWHHEDRMPEGSTLICGLHSRGIIAAYVFRHRPNYFVMVSLSRDGDIQDKVYKGFGYQTIRGSSGKGGARAAIESIRVLKSGTAKIILAMDGSKGPRGIAQEGLVYMAKKSGCAILPVGISANPRKTLRTWDRYCVPKPFCRIAVVLGEPITCPNDADDVQIEQIRLQFQNAVQACEDEADQIVGYTSTREERIDEAAL